MDAPSSFASSKSAGMPHAVVRSMRTLTSPTTVVVSATRTLMPGAQPAPATRANVWGARRRVLTSTVGVARKCSSITEGAKEVCVALQRATLGSVKRSKLREVIRVININ